MCIVVLVVALKLYVVFSMGVCKSTNQLYGKTVIITGPTAGIGKETAIDLAGRGAKVILACRNLSKGNQVKGGFYFVSLSPLVYTHAPPTFFFLEALIFTETEQNHLVKIRLELYI